MRRSCQLSDLPRSSYYRFKDTKKKEKQETKRHDDSNALEHIKEIRDKHPFWGYRHIHSWLNRREGFKIGKNRVLRIMRERTLYWSPKNGITQKELLQHQSLKPNTQINIGVSI